MNNRRAGVFGVISCPVHAGSLILHESAAVRGMSSVIRHRVRDALELEFHVPAAVWGHNATRAFFERLYAIVEGATLWAA